MHLGLQGDYNEYHPHARCQVDNLISGVYYNSEDNISFYTGIEHNVFELGLGSQNYKKFKSTMNIKFSPGGSIKGWKEFFKNAKSSLVIQLTTSFASFFKFVLILITLSKKSETDFSDVSIEES